MLVSFAASQGVAGPGDISLMTIDVARAFFHGEARRELYVELPDEDPMKAKGFVGKVCRSLYGLRDAPLCWQDTAERVLLCLGFVQGLADPCTFLSTTEEFALVYAF